MTNTYYISRDAGLYGGQATDEDARVAAEKVAEMARQEFDDVEFVVIDGWKRHCIDDDELMQDVQQTINDKWYDGIGINHTSLVDEQVRLWLEDNAL